MGYPTALAERTLQRFSFLERAFRLQQIMPVVRPACTRTVSVPLHSRNQNFERQTPTPGRLLIHVHVHEKHHGVDKDTRGQHEMTGGTKVKNLRLYLHTAQKRSLGASP